MSIKLSLIKSILKQINNMEDKKYTIIKYNIFKNCCENYDDNEFTMDIKYLTYSQCIYYLYHQCQKYLTIDLIEDTEDKEEKDLLTILCDGFKNIMKYKRLIIHNSECDCNVTFFIFDNNNKITIDSSCLYEDNYEYDINKYFEF
jgi:hypothetical protein